MKTAISIPDRLFESADALAERLGVSRSHLYATAVAEFLAKHADSGLTVRGLARVKLRIEEAS